MAINRLGFNYTFPIYNADGTPFHGLVMHKATYDSVVMSLGDKITGDVYYENNSLVVTMGEYIVYNGVKFYLVNPPTVVRDGVVSSSSAGGVTKYSFEFYHPMYMLSNFPFSDVAVTESEEQYLSQNKTFSWIGRLQDFIDKLNANLAGTEWHVRYQPSSKTSKAEELSGVLPFDKNTIAEALKTAYDTWEVPFVIISYDGILPKSYKRLEYVKIESLNQSVSGEESPLWLFLRNLPSVVVNDRIYYCKIYNGDELVLHLVPCMNKNGDVGLYDAVSGGSFWSNEEVTFLAGDVVGDGKNYEIIFGLPSNEIYDSDGNVFTFRFGQGLGLKNNSRTPKNNKIVTRLSGYGSERNIPYGYPQIPWTGDASALFTIGDSAGIKENVTINGKHYDSAVSYPIYDGIYNGRPTKLIKHPFTRNHLMPSVYVSTVNKKVNPYSEDYEPFVEIVDYYDATEEENYPNPIVEEAPSYEIHEFDKIFPELGEAEISGIETYGGKTPYYITFNHFQTMIDDLIEDSITQREHDALQELLDDILHGFNKSSNEFNGGSYTFSWSFTSDANFYYVKYTSGHANIDVTVLKAGADPSSSVEWDDSVDENGEYKQSYFKIKLPVLSFDIYASASITEEMVINMRGGACIGCSFTVQVDWDDYKKNFFDSEGNFDPVIGEGHPRDGEKYPDSSQGSISVIVQKDLNTFGTIMPNVFQQPKSGDKFVILGISLPYSYITNAQERLDSAMKEYMLENNIYYYDYPLKFDEHFLATHTDILAQIKNNSVVRFIYGSELPMALYVKQMTIKYGSSPLPQYDITLTDDVEIVLNKIGQVTEDVSRVRVELSELQKYYSQNIIDEINNKLSRVYDDVALGKITFQQGLNAIGEAIFSGEMRSDRFETGLYTGRGWRIDQLGNGEMESLRVRSYLEVVELLVNRLQAQEGDTIFSDNDQIEKVEPEFTEATTNPNDNPKERKLYEREQDEYGEYSYVQTKDESVVSGKTYYMISSYILSLKKKYDGYFTPQKKGNILKGIINTLAAKEAGLSDESATSVEIDGDNKYYTSWMRCIGTRNTDSTLSNNQIRVELYSDDYSYTDPETGETITNHFTPAGRNFPPCELMTIARWGCYLSPDEDGISEDERLSRERRQRMFMISVTDGRVVKYTKVNKPILDEWNYGVTIGELPDFVKRYTDVSSVLEQVGEHTDWLYAQGIVVGKFIKVDIHGKPEVTIVDCGDWVDGATLQPSERTARYGIYLHEGWNPTAQQYETHDVWHDNARWRCLIEQPIVIDGNVRYMEPTDENSDYWKKVQGSVEGRNGKSAVSVFKWHNSPDVAPPISSRYYAPVGWDKTAPNRPTASGDWYLWMSTGNLDDNDLVDFWSTPVRISGDKGSAGEDAEDREWIYIADTEYRNPYKDGTHPNPNEITQGEVSPNGTAGSIDTNKQQDDWVPSGWSDRAIATNDTTNLFVYTSWRDRNNNGVWGDFQPPVLWSNWGRQGLDGDGVQYVFKLFDHELSDAERKNNIPQKPDEQTGGEWIPDGWSDDPLTTNEHQKYCYCSTIKQIEGDWGNFEKLALWSKWSKDGENGTSAPFYFKEQFAWSNDETTASVTTPPNIVGQWEESIPAKNAKYLWRRSVRYVYDESTEDYYAETAQYFRMSGTDGTSIRTKGTVVSVIQTYGTFPSSGISSGNIGIKQGDPKPYVASVSGGAVSWSQSGMSNATDGDSYVVTKECVVDLDGDGFSAQIKGHLITWSEESGKWVDLGEFKGEDGKSSYAHVVWAEDIIYVGDTVTSIVGYAAAKSPNDTTHLWMGIHADENPEDPTSGDDEILKQYTWTYTKGADGADLGENIIDNSEPKQVFSVSEKTPDASGRRYWTTDKTYVASKIPQDESKVSGQARITLSGCSFLGNSRVFIYFQNEVNNTWPAVVDFYVSQNGTYDVKTEGTVVNSKGSTWDGVVRIVVHNLASQGTITIERLKLETGNKCSAWSLSENDKKGKDGKDGTNGARGKIGRFFYFEGNWEDFTPDSAFIVSDAQAPYFFYDNSYWVYDPQDNPTGGTITKSAMGTPSGTSENWHIMVDDFKYIITKAIFSDYAKFGSSVINKDWMISTNGTINGVEYNNGEHYGSDTNPAYTRFDPLFPYGAGKSVLFDGEKTISKGYDKGWTKVTDTFTLKPNKSYYFRAVVTVGHSINNIGVDGFSYGTVLDPSGNPNHNEWYERSGTAGAYTFTRTSDTSVVGTKTYYFRYTIHLRLFAGDKTYDTWYGGTYSQDEDVVVEITNVKVLEERNDYAVFAAAAKGTTSDAHVDGVVKVVVIECNDNDMFVPKYCLDLLTGEVSMGGGTVQARANGDVSLNGALMYSKVLQDKFALFSTDVTPQGQSYNTYVLENDIYQGSVLNPTMRGNYVNITGYIKASENDKFMLYLPPARFFEGMELTILNNVRGNTLQDIPTLTLRVPSKFNVVDDIKDDTAHGFTWNRFANLTTDTHVQEGGDGGMNGSHLIITLARSVKLIAARHPYVEYYIGSATENYLKECVAWCVVDIVT